MNPFDLRPPSLAVLLGLVALLGGCTGAGDDDDSTEEPANLALVSVGGAPVDVPELVGFLVTSESSAGRFVSIEAGTDLSCEALDGFEAAQTAAFAVIDAADTPDWDEWDRTMAAARVEFYGDGSWNAGATLGEHVGDPPLGAFDVGFGLSRVDASNVDAGLIGRSDFFAADYPADAELLSIDSEGATFTGSGTGEWTNESTGESLGEVTITISGTLTRCVLTPSI